MKKSTFWIIIAIISIIFATYYALNCLIVQGIFACATCCASLVIGAYYEREEREKQTKY